MKYTFKTNINCGGCIKAVTPFLDAEARINKWSADTENPDKILSVDGELSANEVMEIVREAGFEIENN